MSDGLQYPFAAQTEAAVNYLKVIIAPDGGIARFRIYGVDV